MANLDAQTKFYHHGRFNLSGGTLPDAVTAYRTYGNPKNPCIVYPGYYGSRLDGKGGLSVDFMIGQDKALDPSKYFIVAFAMFSNGESSSPSNTPAPHNGPYFPSVTYEDNVRAQYNVLTKGLEISKVYAVVGPSMGGQQAYHWALMYPDYIEKFAAVVTAARTPSHASSLLYAALESASRLDDYSNGHYTSPPQQTLRTYGKLITPLCYSSQWYRDQTYLFGGVYASLNDFNRDSAEGLFLTWDANDLFTLARTWLNGDLSHVTSLSPSLQGDIKGVLGSIKPKALVITSRTDLFFPPEESEQDVKAMGNNAKLVVLDTSWGHMAGLGLDVAGLATIAREIRGFLDA